MHTGIPLKRTRLRDVNFDNATSSYRSTLSLS
jgi:hypothetical protein